MRRLRVVDGDHDGNISSTIAV
eukprot:COSAG03_NODE_4870_length_1408_cov_1.457601_2_plen_21_part_01